ncbi:MAG: DUF418 domain-containing protein [Propionibacteriaceae bacterium]|nr:DUF418 domain-containing protein [Propionibacteriaceae bacterium]
MSKQKPAQVVRPQSFTGGKRYPSPDVARGFMLLLIAVANVPVWLAMFPDTAETGMLDRVWLFIRTLFVDHRAYPLFAMLFGFGLMVMVRRRQQAHVVARTAELDAAYPNLPAESRNAWLRDFAEEGTLDARRLVRRRGWWMLLFGAAHALLFLGDIMGVYAVIAILFAGWIVGLRWRRMVVATAVLTPLVCLVLAGQQWAIATGRAPNPVESSYHFLLGPYYPLISLVLWGFVLVVSPIAATLIPATFLGAYLGTTDILTRPQRSRRLLRQMAVGGLTLGALLGLPRALYIAGLWDGSQMLPVVVHELSGLLGGLGWLATLALFVGAAKERTARLRDVLAAVGRRSMTAYVAQSVFFALIFGLLGLSGIRSVGQATGMLIAVAVWAITVGICQLLERSGARGPLEVLLRRAVTRSEKPRTWPPVVGDSTQ